MPGLKQGLRISHARKKRCKDNPRPVRRRTVGLLGGSFDPPHMGHLNISLAALRIFGFDELWWLISPGNPLKQSRPAAMHDRVAEARKRAKHPKIRVSDYEWRSGTRFTAKTLDHLKHDFPRCRFTWVMGGDNLAELHRWQEWTKIMASVRVAVVARPGFQAGVLNSCAARCCRKSRLVGHMVRKLASTPVPAWAFATLPMSPLSSTAIRQAGQWPQTPPPA